VLWEKKSVNVKTLGDKLYLDSGTLTPLLKKLESKGLVTRRRSTEDERSLIVSITSEGERLRACALAAAAEMARCTALTEKETAELYRLLDKILRGPQAE